VIMSDLAAVVQCCGVSRCSFACPLAAISGRGVCFSGSKRGFTRRVGVMQMRKGLPKTLHERETASLQIREPGSAEAAAHDAAQAEAAAAAPGELKTAEDADAEYARRTQAKMGATDYATQQRGCAFLLCTLCPQTNVLLLRAAALRLTCQ
jgi:hypothetical protein